MSRGESATPSLVLRRRRRRRTANRLGNGLYSALAPRSNTNPRRLGYQVAAGVGAGAAGEGDAAGVSCLGAGGGGSWPGSKMFLTRTAVYHWR
jgi:hypothetical protein